MIVSISQPAYLPWLGYFDRISRSDLHIVLDDVLLERSSKTRFTNRNKVRTAQAPVWLTVPVKTAGLGQPRISEALIDETDKWAHKHMRTIASNYARAPYFAEHKVWFEEFYAKAWPLLAPMLRYSTDYLHEALQIKTERRYSSEMQVDGQKSDYILNLCRTAGATTYISGPFGRDYLALDEFDRAGIKVEFHDYRHPVYRQIHGGFEPYMSVVDLLFNEGTASLEILKGEGG